MRYEFKLPDLAEGMVEGELVGWLVAPGEAIKGEQPVAEIMTDKATVAIPSPVGGTVLELPWAAGDIVKVGATLFVLDAASDAPAQRTHAGHVAPESAPLPTAAAAAPSTTGATPTTAAAASPAPASATTLPSSAAPVTPRGARALAAPATRRLARELGVDIGLVAGTGPGGRVTAEDVAHFTQPAAPSAPSTPQAPAAPSPAPHTRGEEARRLVPTWVPEPRDKAPVEGWGLFEHGALGRHDPSGFADWLTVAP